MAVPEGYKTYEQIAADLGVPVSRITKVIKDLDIEKRIDRDNRRRISPENVEVIRAQIEALRSGQEPSQ